MSKTVQTCEEIMRQLAKGGFTSQVSKRPLEMIITLLRGGDPRTLKNWIQTLVRLEYLSMVNVNVFEVNLVKVHGLLESMVKDRSQSKLL